MKLFLSVLFLSWVSIMSFSAQAFEAVGIQKGTEYQKVDAKINLPNQKSVMVLFGYHCPHCYSLEPSIHAWEQTKSSLIHFEQVPAVFNNPNWIFMARVFYTAKLLGILEESHIQYFHALHRDKKSLYDLGSIAKFHSQFGVTEKEFKDTFNSFMVEKKIGQAMKITQASGIDAVPAIVVNGKYRTDVPMAGGKDDLWKVVDTLVKR